MAFILKRISVDKTNDYSSVILNGFNLDILPQYIARKINTEYTGLSCQGYLAYEENMQKPVAVLNFFPVIIKYYTKNIIAAQGGDSIIVPEFRGGFLFKKLQQMCLDLCKKEKIGFLFGFSNENAFPLQVRLGWVSECKYSRLELDIKNSFSSKIIFRLIHKSRFDKNAVFAGADEINFDLFPPILVNKDHKIYIVRSKEYVQYKMNMGAKLIKLPSGFALIAIKNNRVHIGELFGVDATTILKDLLKTVKNKNFSSICVHLSHNEMTSPFYDLGYTLKKESPLVTHSLLLSVEQKDFYYTGLDFDYF